jgi:hypothetical protein
LARYARSSAALNGITNMYKREAPIYLPTHCYCCLVIAMRPFCINQASRAMPIQGFAVVSNMPDSKDWTNIRTAASDCGQIFLHCQVVTPSQKLITRTGQPWQSQLQTPIKMCTISCRRILSNKAA